MLKKLDEKYEKTMFILEVQHLIAMVGEHIDNVCDSNQPIEKLLEVIFPLDTIIDATILYQGGDIDVIDHSH